MLESGGRVFGLDRQTLIQIGIQLFNVSVLAVVLARFMYNPVRDFLQKRADKIKGQLERADDDMAKAYEMKIQYEEKIKNIHLERDNILNTARRLAAEKARHVLSEAKSEADAIRARAALDVEMEQERVKDEMKQAIIDVSSAMAEKLVSLAIDKDTQNRLFDETIAELDETTFCRAAPHDGMIAETTA